MTAAPARRSTRLGEPVHRPRCLVIHPGALGDLLLARPALAWLGEVGYARTIAAAPRLGRLLVAGGAAEAARDFDTLGLHRLFAVEPQAGGSVDPASDGRTGDDEWLGDFDLVVSWFGASDTDYARRLHAVTRRALVARPTPPPGAPCHVSAYLLATLAALGPRPGTVSTPPLRASREECEWVAGWLAERGIRPRGFVALQAGAGSPAKIWPASPRLARRLREAGWPLVVTGGPADGAALGAFLPDGADGTVSPDAIARDWPLDRLAALFHLASAYAGHDSGPTHLAAAVGCPTLALFGPTDPTVWAPVGERVRILAGAGPAAPQPWEGLDVDEALAALAALAGEGAGRAETGEPAATFEERARSGVPV